jgi:hypothetical protein
VHWSTDKPIQYQTYRGAIAEGQRRNARAAGGTYRRLQLHAASFELTEGAQLAYAWCPGSVYISALACVYVVMYAGVQQRKPQQRPAVRHSHGKSLAACVAELTAAARPSTPSDQAAESGKCQGLTVLELRLSPCFDTCLQLVRI